jgi:hypothetical protein
MTTDRPRTNFKIKLAQQDAERLYVVARRRQMMPESLMESLIRIVLRESLVDAVIDDQPVVMPPQRRETTSC